MGLFSGISSAIKKGVKTAIPKVVKGVKANIPKIVLGVKAGASNIAQQARALGGMAKQAVSNLIKGPQISTKAGTLITSKTGEGLTRGIRNMRINPNDIGTRTAADVLRQF